MPPTPTPTREILRPADLEPAAFAGQIAMTPTRPRHDPDGERSWIPLPDRERAHEPYEIPEHVTSVARRPRSAAGKIPGWRLAAPHEDGATTP